MNEGLHLLSPLLPRYKLLFLLSLSPSSYIQLFIHRHQRLLKQRHSPIASSGTTCNSQVASHTSHQSPLVLLLRCHLSATFCYLNIICPPHTLSWRVNPIALLLSPHRPERDTLDTRHSNRPWYLQINNKTRLNQPLNPKGTHAKWL